jgi:hypothetical protein
VKLTRARAAANVDGEEDTTMPVPVTLLYGGLSVLLLNLLGLWVSAVRNKHKAFVGNNPPEIVGAVRAHGNAAEWIPAALVLLLVLELSGLPSLWLHVLGGAFVLGRLFHGIGLNAKAPWMSTVGATINYIVVAAMSLWAIVLHFVPTAK